MINNMTSTFTGDFAVLIPNNHLAQCLFSKTYVYVEKNDTFHMRFMDLTEPVPVLEEPVESSTEYDTHSDSDPETSRVRPIQHLGYFVLSLRKDRLPERPHLGWRVGRGTGKSLKNRNVDFLLARPGDKMSKSLASIHMVFRLNLRSGFLMLRAGSQKVPVEYNISGRWGKLEFEEQQLMYQSSTLLRAGACEYELKYTIEEEHKDAFFDQQEAFLASDPVSEPPLRRIPRKMPKDGAVHMGRYLEFETQAYGAFGWINQGVDTKTGDLIAIKELRINSHQSRLEIMAEVKIGRRFLVSIVKFDLHFFISRSV